jgi:hypothetical protein
MDLLTQLHLAKSPEYKGDHTCSGSFTI